ncbi:MAG: NAD(P)(+) transhydrogenase (Re/Si-specific) subunit beta [Phycisphaerales bacterium]|nr:MAG: NAD(P)(+) transhydrogenase (Re/Si-specific) subunit beta [Phycisphaerales bacterium]
MVLAGTFDVLLARATTAPDAPLISGDVRAFLVNTIYAVAAIFFVFGLKMLSSPRTARRGNRVASVGMLIAVVTTLLSEPEMGWPVIIAGFVVGGLIGLIAAKKVPMTGMPEMVALLNGSGALASAVVAMAEYWRVADYQAHLLDGRITIGLTLLIGMATFTGSVVAFLKLRGYWIPVYWAGKEPAKDRQGKVKTDATGNVVMGWKQYLKLGNPLTFPLQHLVNLLMIVVIIVLGVLLAMDPARWGAVVLIIMLAGILGVLITIPIGGADMPVVVSLLNSYSGLAACAAGFVLHNMGLIIAGSLVGASGLILTNIMCKAMNRSFVNVMAGGFGQDLAAAGTTSVEGKTVRQMDAEEAAMVLEAADKVFVIPGYGMAVAQAQHAVAEMATLLRGKGAEVRFGVHPVAGRMPGHMNVLLAEANVPYEQLADLELNSEMEQCDVALVIGANDVVNPDARRPDSQIAGMPIFDVDKARTVMVCKRSLNPGFAGIENPLFFNENTVMLFGDAKKTVSGIVGELKVGG